MWLTLCATLFVACSWVCPKPKTCPTCPAPRTVTVHEGCWEKMPDLPLAPEDIEGVIDTEEEINRLATAFLMLANYVEEQSVRCGRKPADAPAPLENDVP